jgi:hypothetical protein
VASADGSPLTRRLLIRVYGDSLSMPRHSCGVSYFATYPELLRDEMEIRVPLARVALYNRSSGGASISALHHRYLSDSAYFSDEDEPVLVVQCGVVDCAPRPIPTWIRRLIARLPVPLKWITVKLLHHARPFMLKSGLSFRITQLPVFESTLATWLEHAKAHFSQIFVVNIAPTVSAVEVHSPGFEASIAQYNAAIERVVGGMQGGRVVLIDVYGAISGTGKVTSYVNALDGHHITTDGHKLYAALIARCWTAPRDHALS